LSQKILRSLQRIYFPAIVLLQVDDTHTDAEFSECDTGDESSPETKGM
jgi:hypothetical protein